jgi:UDP-glucose 4-epimerase
MRIIITGALGHIGSRLIRELPSAFPGAQLILLDDLSTQRYCSLFNLPSDGNYRFIEADVLKADLASIFTGAPVVVHLAAITNAAESFALQEEVERVNFIGTQKVAQACLAAGSALLYPSTTSVYGTQSATVDEACPLTDLKPQSPYANSKLKAERYLQSLGEGEGLRFIICRFGTIFGTSPGMRFHTAINKFCWQAANGLPLTVWRTAMEQMRPYLDLGDAVKAIKFIIQQDIFDRRIYNVLTLNASVRQIINIIAAHIPQLNIEYVDTPIMNQLSYKVLNDRFKQLGFEFKGVLEQGITETLQLLKPLWEKQK